MLESPRFRCQRFSGRPEGFGEDASFFFGRSGFGTARWRPRPQARCPVAGPHGTVRRVGWVVVAVGLILCLMVLASLAPRLLLRHTNAVAPPVGQERLHDGMKVIPK